MMLAVARLNQFYGGSHILRDLSFDVPLVQSDIGAVGEVEVVPGDLVPEHGGPLERAQAFLRDGDHAAMFETAASLAEAGAQHLILIMPAGDGPDGLQQLADRVATPLRERFD